MTKFLSLMISFIVLTINGFANCEQMYYQGYKPQITQNKNVKTICYSQYNIVYNTINGGGQPLGPIFSESYLTDDMLKQGQGLKRKDSFHEEPSLNIFQKLFVTDFKGTGYDKGHLFPNGDAKDVISQGETFTMANMIPQTPENNRKMWNKIEGFTRHLVFTYKEGYIFTGPLYDNTSKPFANNKTKIPSHVWKVVYLPQINSGIVFITTNTNTPELQLTTINDFEKIVGYKFFQNSVNIKKLDISNFRFDKTKKSLNKF